MTKILNGVAARVLCGALLFHLAFPAQSRAESPYWIVPGGGFAWLPNEFLVKPSRPYAGMLLGTRINPFLGVEARGTYLKSPGTQPGNAPLPGQASLSVMHVDGNLTWFLAGDHKVSPYVTGGAGVTYLHYEGSPGSLHQFTWGGGGGFRAAIAERIFFRIEGRLMTYKVPTLAGDEELRYEPQAFAGLQFGIGGPPRDKDRDGVPDDDDRCPGTPFGARVDAVGCAIDSDEDGVFDGIDKCPGTPPGAVVDARGCEPDQDFDGVVDSRDKCPGTPQGATVDINGCPHDADQDSVYDGIDLCPSTPAGCVVSATGCQTDSDGDGVCDGNDECPETPESAKVDRAGCPIVVSDRETQLLETGMIRLQNINFETGRAKILPESESALDEVGNILARWPDLRIEIGGHTDSRGTAAKNLKLSRDRAESVLEYLMYKFPELNPRQFTTVGYGARKPIASNATDLGRAKNRRVEFKVLNKEALKREKTKERLVPKK